MADFRRNWWRLASGLPAAFHAGLAKVLLKDYATFYLIEDHELMGKPSLWSRSRNVITIFVSAMVLIPSDPEIAISDWTRSIGDIPAGLSFVSSVGFNKSVRPDATNRPHMISSDVLAYTDGNGIAQQVTLKPLTAPGSTFGTDANGSPNNGARVNSDGSVTITKDGTVLDGYIFTGTITIQANNVTIENFRLDASGTFYGIYKAWETRATGTVIQDGEITGAQYGVSAHDFTALRLNIHDSGEDGVISSGNNGTVLRFLHP